MNVVLLFTFVLGVIELISGFVIQPFENDDYNTKDYIFGEDKALDLDGSTIHGNDAPTTTSITPTEVTILTTLTTTPDAKIQTTTPSVLDDNVTTSNHNVPTMTSITPTEVTILTTLTTTPDTKMRTTTPSVLDDNVTTSNHKVPTITSITPTEVTILTTTPDTKMWTTTPSVLHNNVTTSDHNVPTTMLITPMEVTILTTLTTTPDERTNIPSIDIDDDEEYHNDCDCPPQFLNNVVKCTCTIQL